MPFRIGEGRSHVIFCTHHCSGIPHHRGSPPFPPRWSSTTSHTAEHGRTVHSSSVSPPSRCSPGNRPRGSAVSSDVCHSSVISHTPSRIRNARPGRCTPHVDGAPRLAAAAPLMSTRMAPRPSYRSSTPTLASVCMPHKGPGGTAVCSDEGRRVHARARTPHHSFQALTSGPASGPASSHNNSEMRLGRTAGRWRGRAGSAPHPSWPTPPPARPHAPVAASSSTTSACRGGERRHGTPSCTATVRSRDISSLRTRSTHTTPRINHGKAAA